MKARGTATIPLSKMVATDDGYGHHSVPAGTRSGEIELTVDVDGLLQTLGRTALRNRTRTAREVHGLVIARVRKEWEQA